MKSRNFPVYLVMLLSFQNLFSQAQNDKYKIAQAQTVRIVAISYSQKNGKYNKEFGQGFVLKGEYLATCYHLVSPPDESYKFTKIYMTYNYQYIKGNYSYDSVFLIKNFKSKRGQYNFSNHIYIPADFSTDFVILKLQKKIKPIQYKFSKEIPKLLDTTWSIGNILVGNLVNPCFQSNFFMFKCAHLQFPEKIYSACLTKYTSGFSGSPLFDSHGQILGMIQFSAEKLPKDLLDKLYNENQISKRFYDGIENEYKAGNKLQFSIDISFLMDKYLKGYL